MNKENYTYVRNQPKNEPQIVLENYTYVCNQPKIVSSPVENYEYALYKPERHETQPSPQEENIWQGVL